MLENEAGFNTAHHQAREPHHRGAMSNVHESQAYGMNILKKEVSSTMLEELTPSFHHPFCGTRSTDHASARPLRFTSTRPRQFLTSVVNTLVELGILNIFLKELEVYHVQHSHGQWPWRHVPIIKSRLQGLSLEQRIAELMT